MDQSNVLCVCAQIVKSVCVCVCVCVCVSDLYVNIQIFEDMCIWMGTIQGHLFIFFFHFQLQVSSVSLFHSWTLPMFTFLHAHIFTCWHFGDEHTKAQFMVPIIPVKIWAWSTMLKLHLEICHFWPNSHFYYFLLRCACDFKVIYS